ncbi:MAG: hypothetical protein GY863_05035 [bacterium]|nr:hypothetical protein [bacterium]
MNKMTIMIKRGLFNSIMAAVLTVIALSFPCNAYPDQKIDFSGEWDFELINEVRELKGPLVIEIDGKDVSGTLTYGGDELEIISGSVSGNEIKFVCLNDNFDEARMDFTGKLAGNKITGAVDVEGMGSFEWTAEKEGETEEGTAQVSKPVDFSGEWDFELINEVQELKGPLEIEIDDNKVSGTLTYGGSELEIISGTVSGNEIEFVCLNQNFDDARMDFTGKLSGNKITGTVDVEGMGSFEWTAERDSN